MHAPPNAGRAALRRLRAVALAALVWGVGWGGCAGASAATLPHSGHVMGPGIWPLVALVAGIVGAACGAVFGLLRALTERPDSALDRPLAAGLGALVAALLLALLPADLHPPGLGVQPVLLGGLLAFVYPARSQPRA